jgi:hypothetical protein
LGGEGETAKKTKEEGGFSTEGGGRIWDIGIKKKKIGEKGSREEGETSEKTLSAI